MQFEGNDIGGKEVGAANIELIEDQRRAQELVGVGRALLGELKHQMSFNNIKALSNHVVLQPWQEFNNLLYFMMSGDLDGTASLEKAAKTPVTATIHARISVNSIKGGPGMADQDSIRIHVSTSYNIKSEGPLKVVGFRIHFQDTTPYLANIEYNVSEPLGKNGELPAYLNMRAWFRSSAYYAEWDGVSDSWYDWNGLRYNTYPSYNGEKAKETADSYRWFTVYPDSSHPSPDLTITTNTMKTIYEDETQYISQTKNGMYITVADCFDHIYAKEDDDPKYNYETGYVGAVAKTTRKDIEEEAIIYEPQFEWDQFWLYDEQVLTGNNLEVPKEGTFEPGWYGIMMTARRMEGAGQIEILGGFTFIFELDDGSIRTFDFTNLDLWSGHWTSGANNSGFPLTAGWYFAMFNPDLGIINLYYETDPAKNPFTNPSGQGRGTYGFFNYYGNLYTDVWKDLEPVISKSIILNDDLALDVRKLASF
jgi:hypothetical protein